MAGERETETENGSEAESGEGQIDAEGRNPTQRRMDEEGVEPAPVDASWSGEGPATGAEGPDAATSAGAPAEPNEPVFEPDVSLEAEVNRETAAAGGSRKGVIAGVAGAFALLGAVLLRRRR